jgi:lipopolysaccharide export LptBFGC system permease protein LptF
MSAVTWDLVTAVLDFLSVAAALALAIQGRIQSRNGNNSYERKKNLNARTWNRIWEWMFVLALVFAATSVIIKVVLALTSAPPA